MGSATVRQWHLLTLLPKGPRRVDTATLEELLRGRGLLVHRRTIQRDLVELANVFPLVSDERTKPYGWRWADDAELLCTVPALPGATVGLPEIEVVLHVRGKAARAISDGLRAAHPQRAEPSMQVLDRDPERVEVRAHVADGCALRRWLLGFADAIEVIAPVSLREELAQKASRTAAIYGADT